MFKISTKVSLISSFSPIPGGRRPWKGTGVPSFWVPPCSPQEALTHNDHPWRHPARQSTRGPTFPVRVSHLFRRRGSFKMSTKLVELRESIRTFSGHSVDWENAMTQSACGFSDSFEWIRDNLWITVSWISDFQPEWRKNSGALTSFPSDCPVKNWQQPTQQ